MLSGLNRSSLGAAYALLAASAFSLALIVGVLLLETSLPLPAWLLVCLPMLACTFVVAGVAAGLRRPVSRMGPLMVLGGLVWLLAELGNTEVTALVAIGLVLATVPLAIVYHLLLAFPSGRLRGSPSVAAVAVSYFVCTVMQAPQYLFGGGAEGPATVLQISDRPDLADAGLWAQWAVGSAATIAVATLLWRRWRRVPAPSRRAVAPLLAYGIFAVLYVPVSGRLAGGFGIPFEWAKWIILSQQLIVALVPVAFLVTMLSGGFRRTLAIDELGARIGPGAGGSVAAALAETLGDPTVEFVLWAPAAGSYVDAEGAAIGVPGTGAERGIAEVNGRDGERLGAVLYDATLIGDPDLVAAAARIVAMELDHERLAANLRASAVAARDDERRRLARDLHDGMQTRLLLLAMSANELREDSNLDGDDRLRLERLERGLGAAIEELRTMAQGYLPPTLIERGIYAAAEDLAGAYPGVVERRIEAVAERPPPPVESAAYFVVSEALANTIKHAGAEAVRLSLQRENGSLLIEVEDDGRGGAEADGSGIGGIRDRVEALGGTLSLSSPPQGGTLLRAELPCG